MNTQVIEKVHLDPEGKIEVFKIFSTIQFEGPFAGRPAIFVRLYGCTLQCPNCDTDYSSHRETFSAHGLAGQIGEIRKDGLIVLTGGEPLRQNINPFVYKVMKRGYTVQVETNGAHYLPTLPYNHARFCIVCSPKVRTVHVELVPYVNAWKYVLRAGQIAEDGLPTMMLGNPWQVARPPVDFPKEKIFVQPLDEQNEEANKRNAQATIASSMKHGYTFNLQIQKLVGLP